MSAALPRPVAYVRIAKRWDALPIVVACNSSDKGAKPVWVEEDVQAYAQQARADLEAENKRLREALRAILDEQDANEGYATLATYDAARAALKEQP